MNGLFQKGEAVNSQPRVWGAPNASKVKERRENWNQVKNENEPFEKSSGLVEFRKKKRKTPPQGEQRIPGGGRKGTQGRVRKRPRTEFFKRGILKCPCPPRSSADIEQGRLFMGLGIYRLIWGGRWIQQGFSSEPEGAVDASRSDKKNPFRGGRKGWNNARKYAMGNPLCTLVRTDGNNRPSRKYNHTNLRYNVTR